MGGLFLNHSLVPPFFFEMDGMGMQSSEELKESEELSVEIQEDEDEEKKEEIDDEKSELLPIESLAKLMMDSRKQISSYDSSKWFALLFKVFKFGTLKLRREVMNLLKQILKNKFSKITLEHLSFALNQNSESVLDDIMESIICSI